MWIYLGLLLNVALIQLSQADRANGPIASITQGVIKGVLEYSTKGRPIYTFRKVPFAKPPVGKLRLRNPEPSEEWQGVKDVNQEMPACPQPAKIFQRKDVNRTIGPEDCLYLSIYAPKVVSEDAQLPVLVFFHGGAFRTGSSSAFEGYEFLNEDVVVVVTNYRLEILGFMSTEDDVIPGNFGLKDQTLALRWINENVHQFGGDVDQITIFGMSAGSASAHYHILSPASKGLFKRAILQSGTMLCPWARSEGQRDIAMQIGAAVGCFIAGETGTRLSEKLLECLQKVDAEEFLQVSGYFKAWNFLPVVFGPSVDGQCLPDQPEILLKEGRHAHIDIIVGVSRNEGAYLTNIMFAANEQSGIEARFPELGPLSLGFTNEKSAEEISRQAYQLYAGETRATIDNIEEITSLLGDRHFKICSDLVAIFHSENVKNQQKNVYYYELHHRGQRSLGDVFQMPFGKHWISHADEMFLMFPMKYFGLIERNEADANMRDIITKMWVNFAATGNPTPDNSLGFTWEPFTKASPRHLALKIPPQMEDDSRQNVREFWNSLKTTHNLWLFGDKHCNSSESLIVN